MASGVYTHEHFFGPFSKKKKKKSLTREGVMSGAGPFPVPPWAFHRPSLCSPTFPTPQSSPNQKWPQWEGEEEPLTGLGC